MLAARREVTCDLFFVVVPTLLLYFPFLSADQTLTIFHDHHHHHEQTQSLLLPPSRYDTQNPVPLFPCGVLWTDRSRLEEHAVERIPSRGQAPARGRRGRRRRRRSGGHRAQNARVHRAVASAPGARPGAVLARRRGRAVAGGVP